MSHSTTTLIRAIPTHYKGIRLRSRLEARWATFLDELHLKWAYEPMQVRLYDPFNREQFGYRPDFLITLEYGDVLLEIKRDWKTIGANERYLIVRKAHLIARRTGLPVIVADGTPFGGPHWTTRGGCPAERNCEGCDATWDACESYSDRWAFFSPEHIFLIGDGTDIEVRDPRQKWELEETEEAEATASAARFE